MDGRTPRKERVSVSEMAAMCRLSRSRFQQLLGSSFPYPLYDVSNRRPFYDREMQGVCLEVREKNMGIDGNPIMFYAARSAVGRRPKAARHSPLKQSPIMDGLKALGLPGVRADEVMTAEKKLFPSGTKGVEEREILRQIFVHLMEKRSG